MPYSGTIKGLTFNLFNILADQRLSANALFWITVWITAKDPGPRSKHLGPSTEVGGPWTLSRGLWTKFQASSFKLRGSRRVDLEPGLLGLVARSRSN